MTAPKPIDAEWIAETRALCEAATAGPWHVHSYENVKEDRVWHSIHSPQDESVGWLYRVEDQVMTAAARTALPAALDEIERTRAWLDEAHEEAEQASNQARAEREMSAIDGAALLKEIERLEEQVKVAEGLLFEWASGHPNEAAATYQFLGREDRP